MPKLLTRQRTPNAQSPGTSKVGYTCHRTSAGLVETGAIHRFLFREKLGKMDKIWWFEGQQRGRYHVGSFAAGPI
ncbi:MAG: hypothetical protein D6818_10780, partial [Bacteroidetes bacterium]